MSRIHWLLAAAALALLWLALPSTAQGGAVIDNGVVRLGIRSDGALVYSAPSDDADCTVVGGVTVCASTDGSGSDCVGLIGLCYLPTGYESTAPGCACETWGAAYNGMVSGYARGASEGLGSGITPVGFVATATTAISQVRIGSLLVTHDFHPSPLTDDLYEVTVTFRNESPDPMAAPQYRRAMDWDVQPTAFSEFVTIDAKTPLPTALMCSSNDGFATGNPLTPLTNKGAYGPGNAPGCTGAAFEDRGPADHGGAFDFTFADLLPGEERQFNIYYGASATEDAAETALDLVDAAVWTFGQCNPSNSECNISSGAPTTFFFGFANVEQVPNGRPTVRMGLSGQPTCLEPSVRFFDNGSFDEDGTIVAWRWEMGDGTVVNGREVDHVFQEPGVYPVRLFVTDNGGLTSVGTIFHTSAGDPDCCPVLNRMFDMTSTVGRTVMLKPTWTDPDEGPGFVNVTPLPAGAWVDENNRFRWPTGNVANGTYQLLVQLRNADPSCLSQATVHVTLLSPEGNLPPVDEDQDGVADDQDNCPSVPNRDQANTDRDELGDACDPFPLVDQFADADFGLAPDQDLDRDGVPNGADLCPDVADRLQADADHDLVGDACDADRDGDFVAEAGDNPDNCPDLANPEQLDADLDGRGDACDLAPTVPATAQEGATRSRGAGGEDEGRSLGPVFAILGIALAGLAIGVVLVVAVVRRAK